MWYVIGILIAMAVAIGVWVWRRRRNRGTRIVSFVVLLREQKYLDEQVLAAAAKRAWGADLSVGDEAGEPEDGFVAASDPLNMIMYQGRMHLVNNFKRPYVEDPEELAESIADQRLKQMVLQHKGWFSCDALGVDFSTSHEEITEWYQRLGKLTAELIDESCIGVFLPEHSLLYVVNEQTDEALRSDDPVSALQAALEPPMVQVPGDHPRMVEAVETARRRWPEFVEAFEQRAGENFGVKAPITRGDNTEFIWLTPTAIENDVIYGELANDPVNLPGLRLGSRVKTTVAEINDWIFLSPKKKDMVGGFTIQVISEISKQPREE